MLKTSHQSQTTNFGLILLLVALLVFSNCKRSSIDPRAVNHRILPGMTEPVRVSSEDAEAAEPAMAAAPDGSIYVVWVNHSPENQGDVMIARFISDGHMMGSAVRVNQQPGIATAWRGDPPTVVVGPDQTIFVGWTARGESESGHATDIYLSASRDHAQTFGAPVKVNDDPKPAVHGMHSLVIERDGRIYVAWLDERNVTPLPMKDMKMNANSSGHHMESNREVFMASSTDGGRTFSKNQRVTTNACPCCKTALAVNSDGRLYVSWRQVLPGDLRHIAVASSADRGTTFTSPVIVSDDQWILSGCPVSGSALSIDRSGTLRVLWYSAGKNGETGLYWSESHDNGATFAPRRLVAAGQSNGTPVAFFDGGNFVAVWEGNENGSARVMTARLVESAASSLIATGELPAAATSGERVFVTYIARSGQHQSIWLVSASTLDLSTRAQL